MAEEMVVEFQHISIENFSSFINSNIEEVEDKEDLVEDEKIYYVEEADDDIEDASDNVQDAVDDFDDTNDIVEEVVILENPSIPAYLPSKESRTCGICEGPLRFLLQVHAPISNKKSTFDRTLFVFMCPSMSCLLEDQRHRFKCHEDQMQSRSVKVFRCQMPRRNAYLNEPPEYNKTDDRMNKMANALLDYFKGDNDDKKRWASFPERVARSSDQVIRYTRDDQEAEQLWPISSYIPSIKDIPRCNYCNGPLCLELQILPQLLYDFCTIENDKDSFDWAAIVVYTCADSCHSSVIYKEEFALVQLCSTSTTATATM